VPKLGVLNFTSDAQPYPHSAPVSPGQEWRAQVECILRQMLNLIMHHFLQAKNDVAKLGV
jgi:hypothetical protein